MLWASLSLDAGNVPIGLDAGDVPISLDTDDVLASLDNEGVLHYARLCDAVYRLPDVATNAEQTARFQAAGLIGAQDAVVVQGYRHTTGQLSAVLVKRQQPNAFLAVFVGTKSSWDVLSDVAALPSYADCGLKAEEAFLACLPTRLRVWADARLGTAARAETEHDVGMHWGFAEAGQDFLAKLVAELAAHAAHGQPVLLELTGHSMGGGIAALTAFGAKQQVPALLGILPDMVELKTVLFAAAGAFRVADLPAASAVMQAQRNTVSFYRPHDFARELTAAAGLANPGHVVELGDFVAARRTLLEFVRDTLELREGADAVRAKLAQVGANHTIKNYIATIEAGIGDTLQRAQAEDVHGAGDDAVVPVLPVGGAPGGLVPGGVVPGGVMLGGVMPDGAVVPVLPVGGVSASSRIWNVCGLF